MLPQPEKRKSGRQDYNSPVLVEFNDQEKETLEIIRSKGSGVDISFQGIGLLINNRPVPGQIIKMSIPLGPPDTAISSLAEVRWVKKTNKRYRLGLKFIL